MRLPMGEVRGGLGALGLSFSQRVWIPKEKRSHAPPAMLGQLPVVALLSYRIVEQRHPSGTIRRHGGTPNFLAESESRRRLARAGIRTVAELCARSQEEVAGVIGPEEARVYSRCLEALRLGFRLDPY